MGHDTNTAHFSIMMGPAPHLDGSYTIFGGCPLVSSAGLNFHTTNKRPR